MTPARPAPTAPVTVVGIGADGWQGLPPAAQAALLDAETVIGGPRQLALLPPECRAERVPW
ncbi:cobalamin biosynthesis bifunctional protein CbiET, partial [Streptomyces sp. SID9913]|nr:cobalamin biosynthesis bifunctional protein CbiET [Streptomyces sp. SID9913]